MHRDNALRPFWITLEAIGGLAIGAILFYTVANVVWRTIVGVPLPATIELVTRWWMVPLVFVGFIVAQLRKEHVRVDFVGDHINLKARPGYEVAVRILLILFLLLVAKAGWDNAVLNMQRDEVGIDTQWPVWTTRFAVPILVVVFVAYLIGEAVAIAARWRPTATEATTESNHV